MARACGSRRTLQKQSRINQKSLLKPIAAPLLTSSIQKTTLDTQLHFSSIGGSSNFFHAFCTTKLAVVCAPQIFGIIDLLRHVQSANGPRLITPKENQAQKSD